MNEKHKNGRPRATQPEDNMLVDFLRAKTAHAKREVIKQYAPMYYALTPTTDEIKRRGEQDGQE